MLLKGELVVQLDARGGVEIARLDRGEMVGEMSFIEANPPSATVRASTESVVLSIPRGKLSRKLHDDSAFAARFYRAMSLFLSHRLRIANNVLYQNNITPAGDTGPLSDPDELDQNVMDNLFIAGSRFEKMLNRLLEG